MNYKISGGVKIIVETFYQSEYSNPINSEFMFAYKITISWQIFALAAFMTFIIALLTVSYQAIKVALMNPVKSLRTE